MSDPKPTFSHFVTKLREQHPDLAYLHVVEPRDDYLGKTQEVWEKESNDFLREIWAPKPFISAGGYTRELGIETAEKKDDLIAYGRPFLANVSTISKSCPEGLLMPKHNQSLTSYIASSTTSPLRHIIAQLST